MKTIQILEHDDVIKSGDWIRSLVLEYNGQSDYLEKTSTYGGGRINRLGWLTVDEVFPFFVGKRLRDYYNKKWHYPPTQYEIVRGDVPKSHQEDHVTHWHVSKFDKPTKVSY